MNRKTGEPTVQPEDWDVTQVEHVELAGIAASFAKIAENLRLASTEIESAPPRPSGVNPKTGVEVDHTERDVLEWGANEEHLVEDFLSALRNVRRSWAYWERVAAEYAMKELGMTQRRVASALGVSTSTVNKWAQHPVGFNWDDRDNARSVDPR